MSREGAGSIPRLREPELNGRKYHKAAIFQWLAETCKKSAFPNKAAITLSRPFIETLRNSLADKLLILA
jgi:hypothetical protein